MRSLMPSTVLALAALRAVAADGTQDLPTVVVVGHTLLDATGVPLNEVPSNVQTISGRSVREQGASTLADALNTALGSVSVSNGPGNPYQNDVNYRGYQATSLLGAPVGLSVYFDGVRMNDALGSTVSWDLIPMNAVRSISVMPGSNPVFGLNTLGGALVIGTKNGRDDAGLAISGLGGSFQRKAAEIELGGSNTQHSADYFLSANVDRQDGYREHSASRVAQLYGKARWHGADEKTHVELSSGLADTSLKGTQALPMDMMSDPRSAYTWPDTSAHRSGFLSLRGSHETSESDSFTGTFYLRAQRSISGNSNAALDDGCFNAEGDLATSTLGGVTIFKCADKAPDGTAVNAVTSANALAMGFGRWTSSINSSVVESWTHEHTVGAAFQWAHVTELAGHRNAFYAGVSADQSHIGFAQETRLARLEDYGTFVIPNLAYGFTANGAPPSLANLPSFSGSNRLASVNLTATARNTAAYLTDTLHVTDKFNVTASASLNNATLSQSGMNAQYLNTDGGYTWTDDVSGLSYYNPSYVSAYRYANTTAGAAAKANGAPAGAVPGPEVHGLEGNHHHGRFNPALGFSYSVDGSTSLFGSYSEAMRAPTAIEYSCADPHQPCTLPTGFNGDPDLQPVVGKTFELGGRGSLGGFLAWNAAVYRSRLSHDIQFIATSNTYGYFANVGDTERRGAELGLQGQWHKLHLSGNVGYVEALFRSAFDTATGESVVSGNRIPGVPSTTIKLRAGYALARGLTLGGTLVAVGSQYAHGNESNRNAQGKVAAYQVVNLDLNYRYNDAVSVAAYLNNVFDTRYSTYGLSGQTSIYTLENQQFQTPAPPRAIWVGLTFSLGR